MRGWYHCEQHPEDTAQLTVAVLAVCPAWAEHLRVLRELIGNRDLTAGFGSGRGGTGHPLLVLQAVMLTNRRWTVWGDDPLNNLSERWILKLCTFY